MIWFSIPQPPLWAEPLLWDLAMTLGRVSFLIAIFGCGGKYLDSYGPSLQYAGGAAYPCYLRHHPAVMILGYFVVQWEAGPPARFVLINLVASLVTLVIYKMIVKRIGIARCLFGVRTLRKPDAAEVVVAPM